MSFIKSSLISCKSFSYSASNFKYSSLFLSFSFSDLSREVPIALISLLCFSNSGSSNSCEPFAPTSLIFSLIETPMTSFPSLDLSTFSSNLPSFLSKSSIFAFFRKSPILSLIWDSPFFMLSLPFEIASVSSVTTLCLYTKLARERSKSRFSLKRSMIEFRETNCVSLSPIWS